MHFSAKRIAPLNVFVFFLASIKSATEERAEKNANQQQCHDRNDLGENRGAR